MRFIKRLLLLLVLLAVIGGGVYQFFPERVADFALAGERKLAGLQRHELDIPGFHIVYLDSGGSGEPLLLLHGFGADKDNWDRIARYLTPQYRVIAPDLPGYGESSKPMAARYRIADQVERVQAFAGALGVKKFSIAGNSMGGHIAASFAAAHPDAVITLWLLASAGVFSAPPSELTQRLDSGERNPLIATNAAEFDQLLSFVFTEQPYVPGAIKRVLASRAVGDQSLRQKQFADIREQSVGLEGLVQGLPVPTHIVWGDRDRALHVGGAEILKNLIPGASVTILPSIGHLPMMEQPKTTAEDYLAFREGLKAGASSTP